VQRLRLERENLRQVLRQCN